MQQPSLKNKSLLELTVAGMTECGNVVIIAKYILTLAGMIEDRNYDFIKKQRHSSERWNPVTVDTD